MVIGEVVHTVQDNGERAIKPCNGHTVTSAITFNSFVFGKMRLLSE